MYALDNQLIATKITKNTSKTCGFGKSLKLLK